MQLILFLLKLLKAAPITSDNVDEEACSVMSEEVRSSFDENYDSLEDSLSGLSDISLMDLNLEGDADLKGIFSDQAGNVLASPIKGSLTGEIISSMLAEIKATAKALEHPHSDTDDIFRSIPLDSYHHSLNINQGVDWFVHDVELKKSFIPSDQKCSYGCALFLILGFLRLRLAEE